MKRETFEQKTMKRVKYSKKNDRRFFTQYDMAQLKRDQAVHNSQVKRKCVRDRKTTKIVTCTCGAQGCFALL